MSALSFARSILRPKKAKVEHSLPYTGVELFHWKPLDGRLNFGDQLSQIVVTKMLADRGLFLGEGTKRPSRLLALGSIIHFAGIGDTIWGSGINGKIPLENHALESLDVRAVRGPKTREVLQAFGFSVPEIYGDPALLLPTLLAGRFAPKPARKMVFVPNLHDLASVDGQPDIVSPLRAWNYCIEAILSAELVLASSLHGLIIAEAYGIPARYVRLSESEGLFKYEDYVMGTGRTSLEFARSLDEGKEMGGMPAPTFDPRPLMTAFPFDLWDI